MNEYNTGVPNMEKENKYDKIMMQALTEAKGFEGYFDVVFGYLGRGTDFFMQEDTARETVNDILDKHIEKFRKDKRMHERIAD